MICALAEHFSLRFIAAIDEAASTTLRLAAILVPMSLTIRLLLACMSVAFILGTVVQGVAGGVLSMDMSEASHVQMAALGCADCDELGPDGSSECGGQCSSAQVAALPVAWAPRVTGNSGVFDHADAAFRNRAEPPAQTPPRPRFPM